MKRPPDDLAAGETDTTDAVAEWVVSRLASPGTRAASAARRDVVVWRPRCARAEAPHEQGALSLGQSWPGHPQGPALGR